MAKRKKKAVRFRGQWLGGVKVGLGDSLACVYRITFQVTADVYQDLSELAKTHPAIFLTINKNELGELKNVDAKYRKRQTES